MMIIGNMIMIGFKKNLKNRYNSVKVGVEINDKKIYFYNLDDKLYNKYVSREDE